MTRLIYKLIYLLFLLNIANAMNAQSVEQAKKWFSEGKYNEAKPVFEKLVKQAPNNASYHYLYGVCAYKTGECEAAETYLTTAVARKVPEAYKYLANLYMKDYRFAEAAKTYNEYIELLTKQKKQVEPALLKLIELAEKSQRMVERVENIQIIDSVTVNKENFLSTYKLSEEAGSLAPFKDFFQSEEQVASTVYMNELGDKIHFAHPNVDADGRYNLYIQTKLAGKWGDEKRLAPNVNAEGANVNYPFVMPDGLTLYYASDGEGTIGGYDLYVTRYNINTDTYLTPEQLGMPFNSPANDYMLVIDDVKNLGWFASDRNQSADSVCLYLFIPDPQRTRVEDNNPAVKRSRAKIAAIADTWKAGINYAELVKKGRSVILKQKEKKKDFEFIINNNLVYYTLDEIKSQEARAIYEKYRKTNETINILEQKLDALRIAYRTSPASKKTELKPTILQAEEQLYDLSAQPAELEKRARNAEINFLLKNNR
ncbi:MAG: tetratricopeptide repeat protein [Tannerellaceae bacterium]|jgi:Tfp pilus assembly protein PilF|nr:tetratricopeptide repeat protein [Tannerellaceae bacterium]